MSVLSVETVTFGNYYKKHLKLNGQLEKPILTVLSVLSIHLSLCEGGKLPPHTVSPQPGDNTMNILAKLSDLILTLPSDDDLPEELKIPASPFKELTRDSQLKELFQELAGQKVALGATSTRGFWVLCSDDTVYVLDTRELENRGKKLGSLASEHNITFVVNDVFRLKPRLLELGIEQDVDCVKIQNNILRKGPVGDAGLAHHLLDTFRANEAELAQRNCINWYNDLRGAQALALSPGFEINTGTYTEWLRAQEADDNTKSLATTWERYYKIWGSHFPVVFDPASAITGRFKTTGSDSRFPNTHAAPQDLRKAFSSHCYDFMSADFHQAQPRILCALSKDKAFYRPFLDETDLYKFVIATLTGKPVAEITGEERKVGKALTFGILYGMGAKTLAKKLSEACEQSYTVSKAQDLLDDFSRKFPTMTGLRDNIKGSTFCQRTQDLQHWDLVTPSGRTLRHDLKVRPWKLFNHLAQAVEVEIMVKAILLLKDKLKASLPDGGLLHFMHDELLIYTPRDKAKTEIAERLLRESMEEAFVNYFTEYGYTDFLDGLKKNLVEVSGPAKNWGELKQ